MVANPNIESSCSGLLDNSDPGGPYAGQEGAAVSIAGSVSDVDGPGLSSTWSITPASGVD